MMTDDPDILDHIEATLIEMVAEVRRDRDRDPLGASYLLGLSGLIDLIASPLQDAAFIEEMAPTKKGLDLGK